MAKSKGGFIKWGVMTAGPLRDSAAVVHIVTGGESP